MADAGKRGFLASLGLDRPELRAWALYDVANSAFATTIMVAILPVYFTDVIAVELPSNLRSAYWAYFNASTMFITAILSPTFGYLADLRASKKRFLAFFTLLGAMAAASLAWVQSGQWMLAGIIYIMGNFAFHAGVVFYESLLPHLADRDTVHRLSNSGYALGYLGGGVLLAINLLMITQPKLVGLADATSAVKLSFISVGCVWILFSIPLFLRVKEPQASSDSHSVSGSLLKDAVLSLIRYKDILMQLRRYPQVLLFLCAFWAYSDGVGTIINMATIYGREVGIESKDLTLAILLVQFLGVPASFAFGPITSAIGPKRALNITLVVYALVSIIAYFMSTALHFWFLAVGVALVQGANQAISRSIFSSMIPVSRSGEFFGLFSISSKFAGLLGPLVFGLLASQLGQSRYSVLFVLFLFILGLFLFNRVDIEKGVAQAQNA